MGGGGGHPVAGVDYPRNWHELMAWFPDEGACLRYLERVRWGEGFACRFCREIGGEWWRMGDGLRRCKACRGETSVTAGTTLAGTRLPLVSWFGAVWYVVNQKQGVSALGLQRVLGFGSYQTAWAWLHKLRRAMVRPERELLGGVVEVDETHVGGVKHGYAGRGTEGKTLVAIAVECHERGPGRTRMRRIPAASKAVLTDFVLDHVEPHSEVHTDGWFGYNGIGRHAFRHVVTNISASGDRGHVAMPEVHRVSSLLKRWLMGTHQGAAPTSSSTTTSTSSPSASTAADRATADCSSTACSSRRSRPTHTLQGAQGSTGRVVGSTGGPGERSG